MKFLKFHRRKSVDQVLRYLDDWFVKASPRERNDLWSVLTALRGPDDMRDKSIKGRTTAIIRTVALPKLRGTDVPAYFADPSFTKVYQMESDSPHFDTHVAYAVIALKRAGREIKSVWSDGKRELANEDHLNQRVRRNARAQRTQHSPAERAQTREHPLE